MQSMQDACLDREQMLVRANLIYTRSMASVLPMVELVLHTGVPIRPIVHPMPHQLIHPILHPMHA
jgi:hypothetical protein